MTVVVARRHACEISCLVVVPIMADKYMRAWRCFPLIYLSPGRIIISIVEESVKHISYQSHDE